MSTHGQLWTARQAAAALAVSPNVIEQWVHRGLLQPARRRPTLLWSDDVYDCEFEMRNRFDGRDSRGRFAKRTTTV